MDHPTREKPYHTSVTSVVESFPACLQCTQIPWHVCCWMWLHSVMVCDTTERYHNTHLIYYFLQLLWFCTLLTRRSMLCEQVKVVILVITAVNTNTVHSNELQRVSCNVLYVIIPKCWLYANCCRLVVIVENERIIPGQKRKEANKRPHGSNFHMKTSEVPDDFRAPVFNGCQKHSMCM